MEQGSLQNIESAILAIATAIRDENEEDVEFVELGRTTLTATGDTITVQDLPARKYLKVIMNIIASGSLSNLLRLNSDSSTNYARRTSSNGAADAAVTGATALYSEATGVTGNVFLVEMNIVNIASSEKVMFGKSVTRGTAGSGAAPNRTELSGKWVNTSDQITRLDLTNIDTGDFAIGSEVIVYGHN